MAHPELPIEQAYLDRAQHLLEEMQARTAGVVAALDAPARDGDVDAAIARAHLRNRLWSLGQGSGSLCFGRIDPAPPSGATTGHGGGGGERFYIGRRHVEDRAANPVVVDWRAPIAAAFYRATAANPLDLHLRRRFVAERGRLVDCVDDIFDDPDHPELATGGG